MNFIQFCRKYAKYFVIGVQVFILLIAVFSWLIHRGSAYGKTFALDEYVLSEHVIVSEDVTTDEIMGQGGIFLSTPSLSLKKGTYQIQINYNADRPGSWVSVSCGLGAIEYTAPSAELDPVSHSATVILDLGRNADDVCIQAHFSGNGYLSITNMGIYETGGRYKKTIFHSFLLCLLIGAGYFFLVSDTSVRKIMFFLAGIFLTACYPLYADFIIAGHDLPFHLLRIDAISQGLSQGIFPVKLHPLWAKDYGYAAGIFYGGAFLYFPAFLRLAGFSIQAAYKYYVAFINLGTVLISYTCFRKMFSNQSLGLLGCLAYTLSPYRLMDMYTRASVGEYTAMMFLPLILYGFYSILEAQNRKLQWKPIIITALGMTGLIQSHILSCLMVVFTALLACILLIRRVFHRQIFLSLICATGLTILLNLGFIVPFLDFFQEDVMINSPEWTGGVTGSFQGNGLFPIQLFALFGRSKGGAWATTAGISTEPTFGIGILFMIGMALFLYLLMLHFPGTTGHRNYKPALVCMLLGCLLLYMSTCYFPWDALISLGDFTKTIIDPLQFPWRMLAPATAVLTFVLCYAFQTAQKYLERHFEPILLGSLILLVTSCGWYFYDFSFTGEPYRIYNTYELNTMTMYSYDYLPAGTDPEAIQENLILTDGIVELTDYQKQGTQITCTVSAGSDGGYIEFPLLYYKYYCCKDINTGQTLPIYAGTNNMVRISLPENYHGSIHVCFAEPWFWRLAEIISFLTLSAVILWMAWNIFKMSTKFKSVHSAL